MQFKIIGINKDNGNHQNPHEAVNAYIYEGADGKPSYYLRQKMVDELKKGSTAYAFRNIFSVAECKVRSNGRIEFLQTVSNGKYTDNLLSLPEYNIN